MEKHIAVKWHIITLQEATEYPEHEFLTNRFHVTHYGGCTILFSKDTFFSVNSTPKNTARTELHSTITRTRVAQVVLHASLGLVKCLSSTCHVSHLAVLLHKYTFTIIFLSYLSTNLTETHNTFGER